MERFSIQAFFDSATTFLFLIQGASNDASSTFRFSFKVHQSSADHNSNSVLNFRIVLGISSRTLPPASNWHLFHLASLGSLYNSFSIKNLWLKSKAHHDGYKIVGKCCTFRLHKIFKLHFIVENNMEKTTRWATTQTRSWKYSQNGFFDVKKMSFTDWGCCFFNIEIISRDSLLKSF